MKRKRRRCACWRLVFTVDVVLLLRGHHRQKVTPAQAAVLLGCVPTLPAAEVTVAEALKLVPAGLAYVQV